jgi:hypothetical protein
LIETQAVSLFLSLKVRSDTGYQVDEIFKYEQNTFNFNCSNLHIVEISFSLVKGTSTAFKFNLNVMTYIY